jgi:hypothetical protein
VAHFAPESLAHFAPEWWLSMLRIIHGVESGSRDPEVRSENREDAWFLLIRFAGTIGFNQREIAFIYGTHL